jgi:GNAT superfamily N-acetyltransferase
MMPKCWLLNEWWDYMIKQIFDNKTKQEITEKVLADLTEWFGISEARENYIMQSSRMPFFTAYAEGEAVGFISLKETSPVTAEIFCMGAIKKHHRQGIGRQLFAVFENYAKEKGYKLIQAKTVQYGKYKCYDQTNLFYRSLGFYELEVFPTLWDERNPCQIYVKPI